MAQVLVRDLDERTVDLLKEFARSNNRSLQGEVKAIIEEAVALNDKRSRFLASVERWRARWTREGRTFSDSVELLRDARDSR